MEELAAAVGPDEIDLLSQKLREAVAGRPSDESRAAGCVLAKAAAKNETALKVIVDLSLSGFRPALDAIACMEPNGARRMGREILSATTQPEIQVTGALLLSVVGARDDEQLLQSTLREKKGSFLESYYSQAVADLRYKLENAGDDIGLWDREGLKYWGVVASAAIGKSEAMSWWRIGKSVSASNQVRLPVALLSYRLSRSDPLAIALAGYQKVSKAVPELERLARGSGDSATLARWSLAEIGSEEAVNACLTASVSPQASAYEHQELAKFAANRGGRTTIPLLEKLAKDEALPEDVRQLYADAAQRLDQRLQSATSRPD